MHAAPPSAGIRRPQHPSATSAEQTPPWRQVVDNPWLIVAMLFLVTAALGLPLLWISRGFSPLAKVLLTIAVLIWTALVLWVFYLIMSWCLLRIWDNLQLLFS